MTTWTIGAIRIDRIEEQLGVASAPPEKYFIGFDRETMTRHLDWLAPDHYSPERDRLVTSVHSWLIRTGRHTILLDCCAGNRKDRPWTPRFHQLNTPFLQHLAAAGVAPEDIDVVLCTHLHADHVGWNTVLRDGRWVPTFSKAVYLFSRKESLYWDPDRNSALRTDPRRQAYLDSVLPVVEAGQAKLVDDGYEIEKGVWIEAAAGHTPGHVVLRLSRSTAQGIFCGDAIHHPLQVYAPHWNHMADERPQEAQLTRRRLLEECAEQRACLFPAHFGFPHVVEIGANPEGFSAKFIHGSDG